MDSKINVAVWETMTQAEFVKRLVEAMLVREGEVITPDVALERANNIATGMCDCAVVEGK